MTTHDYLTDTLRTMFPQVQNIAVTFDAEDERITVTLDGCAYTFTAGSDDDEFCFECAGRAPIIVPVPDFELEG